MESLESKTALVTDQSLKGRDDSLAEVESDLSQGEE